MSRILRMLVTVGLMAGLAGHSLAQPKQDSIPAVLLAGLQLDSKGVQTSLGKALSEGKIEFEAEVPSSPSQKQVITIQITDIKPDERVDLAKLFFQGTSSFKIMGKVKPFKFTYTTDVNGPPARIGEKVYKRSIIYPITVTVRMTKVDLKGVITLRSQSNGVTVDTDLTAVGEGTLTPDVPRAFQFSDEYRARHGLGKLRNSLQIPVDRRHNDPADGPLGWEYITWDKPHKGVRQPRRDDLKGEPELARANGAGIWNFYLFVKRNQHPFEIRASVKGTNGHIDVAKAEFALKNKLVPCPDDFKKAAHDKFKWDYAIEASGPGAGLVQDLLQGSLIGEINKFCTMKFSVKVAARHNLNEVQEPATFPIK